MTTLACFGCMTWLLSISPYEEVLSIYLIFCLRLQSIFVFSGIDLVSLPGVVFSLFFHEQKRRVALLMATALFQGASIGPLIDLAIQIDPRYMSLGRFSYVCFYLYLDLCCKMDVSVHIFGHSTISVFVKWCYSLLMAVVCSLTVGIELGNLSCLE